MGAKRVGWVQMNPYTRSKEKTRRKKPQMGENGTFCEVRMYTVQTNRKVVTIGMLFGEDDWEEFRHIKGFRVCIVCVPQCRTFRSPYFGPYFGFYIFPCVFWLKNTGIDDLYIENQFQIGI